MQATELNVEKKSLEPLGSNSTVSAAYPRLTRRDKSNGRVPETLGRTNAVKFEGFTETNMLKQRELASTVDLATMRVIDCSNLCRKRPGTELDTASEVSPVTENDLSILPADLNGPKKKQRSGSTEILECCSPGHANALPDRCQSESHESVYRRILKEKGDLLFVREDMESKERHFFPVMSNVSETLKAPSAGALGQYNDGVPNLDLALGAKTTDEAKKEVLPLLVGVVDKTENHGEPLGTSNLKKEADSVSGSLSLSLSFPFPDEERRIKPASDAEQLIQGRPHVSTSLLLFGGLLDK